MKNLLFLLLISCAYAGPDTVPDFLGPFGEPVFTAGWPVHPPDYAEVVISTYHKWNYAFAVEGVECDLIDSFRLMTVYWHARPFLNGDHFVNGYFTTDETSIHVGYIWPYSESALGHEMSHFILYVCGLDWYHPDLDRWNYEYGTPK